MSSEKNDYPYNIRDVHISDPFILADPVTHHYFTYVQFVDKKRFPEIKEKTGVFYYLESEDLVHWTRPEICYSDKGLKAKYDLWAPEVHIYQGKYYLFSSFREKGKYRFCDALVADSPRGPFKRFTKEGLTPKGWQCLDGTLYIDLKGKPWLVFCHEWLQVNDGQICAVELKEDLSEAVGEPTILFRASDGPWVGQKGEGALVTDGPFLYRCEDGSLLMLWSSFTKKGAYAVAFAKSESGEITGPWIQEKEPLYAFDGGHGMLFKTFAGQLMMSIHCPNDHPKKRILLFEIEEKDGRLAILNECTGNWYGKAMGKANPWDYPGDKCKEKACFSKDPKYKDAK